MKPEVFAARRREFMSKMEGGVALLASAPARLRNADNEYDYRQDSDFYYLTGFEEPESVCLLAPGHPKYEYVLFVRERNREMEAWTGARAGTQGAVSDFRAEYAYPIDQLEEALPEFLQNAPALYYAISKYPEWDPCILEAIASVKQMHRLGIYPPARMIDPTEILAEMRLHKKPEELEDLQRAVDISAKAHRAAMLSVSPGKYEYEVQAVIEYVFRSHGAPRNGYPTIVGSGPNACVLHYTRNNRQMQAGDLLLVDAGAEFGFYSGDITRTYPVSGKFSPEQRAVYDLVLSAQQKAIDTVKPGNSFIQVHETAVHVLTEGMISLGLLSGSVDENIENLNYKKYYLHRTSHWLGLDVHDAGKYKQDAAWRILEPGMVLTVEPGLYIPEEDEHAKFRGIGIRIEDDVLVTQTGNKVLSSACPKQVDDLEKIVGSRNQIEPMHS
ncbi:MAG TPA: aminopeptidase P N-terminal domain-containing protein [Acidobacteriota bacterium]|nr:aminopeptidase P N-terminal domain-containing protein [Acidobacteriota bacterium]